ncbi:MAG: family 20 glycosylhydrolase [Clostridia bacterium]|nr:family 20 glycosylhydrolase [Clostridia bacterium]
MFDQQVIQSVKSAVERTTGVVCPFEVTAGEGTGLSVTLENGKAYIEAESANALARGFFLLARCVKEKKDSLCVSQKRHFSSCGVMLDVSRGAVMTVPAVKRFIDRMACLGMNLLMLYTEDTYEVKGYPHMGYLRGRYSAQDLRELDAYAASMGVELVPCIQTLGHMRQFLQWNVNEPLRDQKDILLIDEEKTYALIEAMIASMRDCMHTDRIHIGMDEAHGVGFGEYWLRHGDTNRFELLRRHLERVVKICEKHGFRPMMWSDMFFRLGSKTNDYYDVSSVVPQEVIDHLPQVDLCYWDYYHSDPAFYDHMLTQHARMGRTVFAGGVWTWSGFLPHVKRTEATMKPALETCARHHVDTVFATMWGDDGAETNAFLACGLLPLFSEACWQGAACPQEEMDLAGECLTGMPRAVLDAMGNLYKDKRDMRSGKGCVWCDPFYPLLAAADDTPEEIIARARAAMDALEACEDRLEVRYAMRVFDVVIEKARLIRDMRRRYIARDRAWLRETAHVDVPRILQKYEALENAHRALWARDMKRFGWEVICLRYGAVMERLRDCALEIRRFLDGEIAVIEELEETPLDSARADMHFELMVTPSADMGMGF